MESNNDMLLIDPNESKDREIIAMEAMVMLMELIDDEDPRLRDPNGKSLLRPDLVARVFVDEGIDLDQETMAVLARQIDDYNENELDWIFSWSQWTYESIQEEKRRRTR